MRGWAVEPEISEKIQAQCQQRLFNLLSDLNFLRAKETSTAPVVATEEGMCNDRYFRTIYCETVPHKKSKMSAYVCIRLRGTYLWFLIAPTAPTDKKSKKLQKQQKANEAAAEEAADRTDKLAHFSQGTSHSFTLSVSICVRVCVRASVVDIWTCSTFVLCACTHVRTNINAYIITHLQQRTHTHTRNRNDAGR